MRFLTALLRNVLLLTTLFVPAPLFAQAQVSGQLLDATGAAVTNAEVRLTTAGSEASIQTTRTDAKGEFTFDGLAAGTYDVRTEPTGFRPLVRRLTVNAAARIRIELVPQLLGVAEQVTVAGVAESDGLPLDTPSDAGSRLGLTARELPATLEVVPQAIMQTRGQRTVQEAVQSTVGVTVGDSPGNPSIYSTRGFAGNQVSVLQDSLRAGPPQMVSRPMDVWNLERVEVLKGPASALFGEGAVGGAVNYVFRRPDGGPRRVDGLLSYGGFNTARVGLGAGGPLGTSSVHYRADYALNDSDGYIDRTPSRLQSVTSALAWIPSPISNLQISFDVLDDDIGSYWGTPLVPASFAAQPIDGVVETPDGQTVDKRMRHVNYNVADDVMDSTTIWTRVRHQWRPVAQLSLRNEFYYLDAEREWRNAETYAFNPATRLIDRDRFFVAHDQSIAGYRVDLQIDRPIHRFANRFLAGAHVNALDFVRPSFFTVADAVDPFNPAAGVFGVMTPAEQQAYIDTAAFYVEDYFPLRSDLKIAGSLRVERIDLDRRLFNAAGILNATASFSRVFTPVTWKGGVVYDVHPTASLYGHVATAADPVGTDLFLVRSGENFDLARGVQMEVGVKQTLPRGFGEWTAAWYRIEREDILTQTSLTTAEPAGQQSSVGVEAAVSLRPAARWQFQVNAAFVDAQFDEFASVANDRLVSYAGNRPSNVPRIVTGAWGSYRFGVRQPLEVGASYRHVGERFNTFENAVKLLPYDLVDAFGTWTFQRYQVTVRARNLFNEAYAAWGDNFYPTQVLLGPQRSAEVSFGFRF